MTRAVWLRLGRVVFLAVTGFFAWWSLRGRWDEVGGALAATSWPGLGAALVLVAGGLVATGFVWLRVLRAHGHRLPVRDALAIFFVGQLGKYVPGSVWSIGVQARLAQRHDVPVRTTVGASLVFLGFHVVTGVLLGGVLALGGVVDPGLPRWVPVVAVVLAVVGLVPVVVNRAGSVVSSADDPLRLRAPDVAVVLVLMGAAWTAYSLALWCVVPAGEDTGPGTLGALAAAFALAHAAGVVVVLAPAGLGAREGTFVVLLAPVVGVAAATGIALLGRVLHSVADFGLAAAWWRLSSLRHGTTPAAGIDDNRHAVPEGW